MWPQGGACLKHTGDTALLAPRSLLGQETRGRIYTSQLCELLGTSLQPIWEAQGPSMVTWQAPHRFSLEHTIPHSSSNALWVQSVDSPHPAKTL